MTEIKVLQAPAVHQTVWHLPQCEADLKDTGYRAWRVATGKDGLCHHRAHYEIEGEKLCTRHAGDRALAILLRGRDERP